VKEKVLMLVVVSRVGSLKETAFAARGEGVVVQLVVKALGCPVAEQEKLVLGWVPFLVPKNLPAAGRRRTVVRNQLG
jgi:hypothetical protein